MTDPLFKAGNMLWYWRKEKKSSVENDVSKNLTPLPLVWRRNLCRLSVEKVKLKPEERCFSAFSSNDQPPVKPNYFGKDRIFELITSKEEQLRAPLSHNGFRGYDIGFTIRGLDDSLVIHSHAGWMLPSRKYSVRWVVSTLLIFVMYRFKAALYQRRHTWCFMPK